MDEPHDDAERRAITVHAGRLAEEWGRAVNYEEAEADWLEHCAMEWRRKRQALMLAQQREEMLRYKWIQSEKAQCDVGKEVFMDWIKHYAARWREWYDDHEVEILEENQLY